MRGASLAFVCVISLEIRRASCGNSARSGEKLSAQRRASDLCGAALRKDTIGYV